MSRWRFIESGKSGAFYNMALDEALARSVSKESSPALRFYSWEVPSVSIGRFQDIRQLDLDYLNAERIPLVRRITGGRGILHAEDLTYSFSAQSSLAGLSGGLHGSYMMLGLTFFRALQTLDLMPEISSATAFRKGRRNPLCFESSSAGEITVDGRKVVGSAQKRWSDGFFMQQGSIPLTIDYEKQGKIFGVDRTEQASMAGLRESLPKLKTQELQEALIEAFETVFEITFRHTEPTDEELALAQTLEQQYFLPEWNLNRPIKRKT